VVVIEEIGERLLADDEACMDAHMLALDLGEDLAN
jgi:hypothetical protein